MNKELERLIEQGKSITFGNNSKKNSYGEIYSNASSHFLAWVAGIEHYLTLHYEEDAGPFSLFKTLDKNTFNGYDQNAFEKQITILNGVLLACSDLKPNKKKDQDQNPIINLLKNQVFWTTTVILVSAAFTVGFYLGNVRFDSNLIALSDDKKTLQDSLRMKEQLIQKLRHNSDSALNILSHMPYKEMTLNANSFLKVQTTIENAGAVLYLNK